MKKHVDTLLEVWGGRGMERGEREGLNGRDTMGHGTCRVKVRGQLNARHDGGLLAGRKLYGALAAAVEQRALSSLLLPIMFPHVVTAPSVFCLQPTPANNTSRRPADTH